MQVQDFGNNLFICTNFSDGCEGDITVGSPETCEITNDIVFCDKTAMLKLYEDLRTKWCSI